MRFLPSFIFCSTRPSSLPAASREAGSPHSVAWAIVHLQPWGSMNAPLCLEPVCHRYAARQVLSKAALWATLRTDGSNRAFTKLCGSAPLVRSMTCAGLSSQAYPKSRILNSGSAA